MQRYFLLDDRISYNVRGGRTPENLYITLQTVYRFTMNITYRFLPFDTFPFAPSERERCIALPLGPYKRK